MENATKNERRGKEGELEARKILVCPEGHGLIKDKREGYYCKDCRRRYYVKRDIFD